MIERRTWLVIIVLAVIAFAAWMEVWLMRARDTSEDFTGPPRSDYTMNDFTLDALDSEGAHSFTVTGPRMSRRGDDGSVYVTRPNYEIVDNSSNTWKGTSDSAWVDKDGNVMKLEGKVLMHREPTDKAERVDLDTNDLTITTDPKLKDAQGHPVANAPHRNKRMETAAPTRIVETDNTAYGVGMKADLDLKTVELLSDVHIVSMPGKGK
ncbi:MAG: LPS export ABC transporter periplasmic protein LptC [Proteobacteria bacterium]|uniref:LPS export ABC transporter periplasmic protein LptC n=1 Tax=Rudaea sp. TaxID=2136325 RepID=UPI001D8E8EA6|nr:LPS export ABC transporter periplasmic protein LptC [Pseudomonadota bacterium]MBS0567700.1 LPS export ABC transporter periplasmic protein LptC [Pseudomonadota bacterium]